MLKAARFNKIADSTSAFVATNSITQGEQVAMLWPLIYAQNNHIHFAHRSFNWSNLATNKAAVTCVVIGVGTGKQNKNLLFSNDITQEVDCIGPYLVQGSETIVHKRRSAVHHLSQMDYGNKPTDGGNLILSDSEYQDFVEKYPETKRLIRRYIGSRDFINSIRRYCFWIESNSLDFGCIPVLQDSF